LNCPENAPDVADIMTWPGQPEIWMVADTMMRETIHAHILMTTVRAI